MSTATQTKILRQLRQEAGLSPGQVAEKLTTILNRPVSAAYVIVLEHRGTQVFANINAFAQIYQKEVAEVAEACRIQKNISN